MSSPSSSITSHYDDDDDNCSCDTYSSGWERSSLSDEYWGSTSTEEKEDDEFCAKGEFYVPPQQITGIKIFDLEYKCDLVVLPHPYKKTNIGREEENTILPLPQSAPASPVCANPWKKIETEGCVEEDPWKFLETKKEVTPPHPPPPTKVVTERKKQVIDNSNTNKLCKYKGDCRRMNRHHSCTMVHSLAEWKPRICRFNNGCRRKSSCGYYHTETSLKEYLRIMITTKDSIYAKNSTLYEKYL